MQYPGIGIQAIGLTFGILASLLFCYKSGIIKPTENFRLMKFQYSPMNHWLLTEGLYRIQKGSWGSIGISLGIVCFASLSLVLDFDYIEEGAEKGLPKYMEWYGAFSLMVTLIWLYFTQIHEYKK